MYLEDLVQQGYLQEYVFTPGAASETRTTEISLFDSIATHAHSFQSS